MKEATTVMKGVTTIYSDEGRTSIYSEEGCNETRIYSDEKTDEVVIRSRTRGYIYSDEERNENIVSTYGGRHCDVPIRVACVFVKETS